MRTTSWTAACCFVVGVLGACGRAEVQQAKEVRAGPNKLISATQGFYFLPPTVLKLPKLSGTFDPNVNAVARICKGTGACDAKSAIAVFTATAGTGGGDLAKLKAYPLLQSYVATWDTRKCATGACSLTAGASYRLHVGAVTPSGKEVELGFADLQVVSSLATKLDTGNFSPLMKNLPYVIAFRVETHPTAPSVTITSPVTNFATNAAALSVQVSYAGGADGLTGRPESVTKVELEMNGAVVGSQVLAAPQTSGVANFSLDTAALPDQVLSLRARAYGRTLPSSPGMSAGTKVVLDRTPPVVVFDAPQPGALSLNNTGSAAVLLVSDNLSGVGASDIGLELDGADVSMALVPLADGRWSYSPATLGAGQHAYRAWAADRAGNKSALAQVAFVVVNALAAERIGLAGGSLSVTDVSSQFYGVTLMIPPGALLTNEVISISELPPPVPYPTDDLVYFGHAVDLRPEGLTFISPAELTIPYGDVAAPPNLDMETARVAVVDYSDPAMPEILTTAGQDRSAKTVTAYLSHFSPKTTAAVPAGRGPGPKIRAAWVGRSFVTPGTLTAVTKFEAIRRLAVTLRERGITSIMVNAGSLTTLDGVTAFTPPQVTSEVSCSGLGDCTNLAMFSNHPAIQAYRAEGLQVYAWLNAHTRHEASEWQRKDDIDLDAPDFGSILRAADDAVDAIVAANFDGIAFDMEPMTPEDRGVYVSNCDTRYLQVVGEIKRRLAGRPLLVHANTIDLVGYIGPSVEKASSASEEDYWRLLACGADGLTTNTYDLGAKTLQWYSEVLTSTAEALWHPFSDGSVVIGVSAMPQLNAHTPQETIQAAAQGLVAAQFGARSTLGGVALYVLDDPYTRFDPARPTETASTNVSCAEWGYYASIYGKSSASCVTAALPVPRNLAVQAISSTEVLLTWVPVDEPEIATYYVYRNGVFANAEVTGGDSSGWILGGLSPGQSYNFSISAVDRDGLQSFDSASAAVTMPANIFVDFESAAGLSPLVVDGVMFRPYDLGRGELVYGTGLDGSRALGFLSYASWAPGFLIDLPRPAARIALDARAVNPLECSAGYAVTAMFFYADGSTEVAPDAATCRRVAFASTRPFSRVWIEALGPPPGRVVGYYFTIDNVLIE